MISVVLSLLALALFCLWASVRRKKRRFDMEWRRVPPPNWRSSRGGRDYF